MVLVRYPTSQMEIWAEIKKLRLLNNGFWLDVQLEIWLENFLVTSSWGYPILADWLGSWTKFF